MLRALVTGAGGFLGGALARRLRARGWEIRGLSRGHYPELDELGVESLRGDIADQDAVARAVEGCDVVFHVAAKVGAWGHYEEFHRTNVVGTRNVVDACRRSGVGRLVYTSTPSVVFAGRDIDGADETLPYPSSFDAAYPRTKALAEQHVLGVNNHLLRTVALRPHMIWGPGDNQLLPRLIARAREGKLVRLRGPAKLIDVTYIDDAVEAHVLAADRLGDERSRVAGKAYFISAGEPVEVWWMIDRLLECADLPPVQRSVSPRVALALAGVIEVAHKILRHQCEPALSRWIVRELTTSHWFCIDRARQELGYEPGVSISAGLERLREHLRSTS